MTGSGAVPPQIAAKSPLRSSPHEFVAHLAVQAMSLQAVTISQFSLTLMFPCLYLYSVTPQGCALSGTQSIPTHV